MDNREIFYNGIYDGKSFYKLEPRKRFFNSILSNVMGDERKFDLSIIEKPTIRKYLNWYKKHEIIFYYTITKHINSTMKTLFKMKLILSDKDFIVFNIDENFEIDEDSIH